MRHELMAGADALGCPLDDAQADRLLGYLDLLARWNKVYNLTALRDPAQMLTHHLLDSLAVIAPMRRHTGGAATAVLDVGSGGGLPGVVIAATQPNITVTCVDTVQKKVTFVRQVAAELRLPNLQARHTRVEAITDTQWPLITARAFASLPDIVTLTRPLLAPGGVWMTMKGQHPADEIAALPADVEVFHVEPLQVPGLNAERCIVWMRMRNH
ncbi:16S rRNA (guanine(527)-N(7))-methyltransferase RsmG [Sphaerotilus sp.]|uniref:16S rRNA (guanine(527)-N(7))-methyltransferase RsmG n=1 Tax=Sphaerotilus sp. TaxID=2093942 RepID=UPI002ACE42AF|nr:16S rRNA (guanine(527)-N(7))-methyltransferase RsmG [Sphaerotilus sp.]MDZ7858965.1 16S rRNA (guanine(527)-N(7))-methyltransferase RsmG [Sphaerotilus sp.]